MRRFFLAAIVLTSAILITGATLRSGEEQPKVIRAVAPSAYPAVAKAARAEGKVIIEVRVSAAGDVTEAKYIEGPKLLEAISKLAAKSWKFAPGSDARTARLTFTFRNGYDKDIISFIPPYEVEFIGRAAVIDTNQSE